MRRVGLIYQPDFEKAVAVPHEGGGKVAVVAPVDWEEPPLPFDGEDGAGEG